MKKKDDATLDEIKRFYCLLEKLGDKRSLKDGNAWGFPKTKALGVYFIFENGETRARSRTGCRVVYVGVSTTLRQRLTNHLSGSRTNSSFRNIVGNALEGRDRDDESYCLRAGKLEEEIEMHIGTMSFLWVGVDGKSDRESIEKNAIGLLSTPKCTKVDKASSLWLGQWRGNSSKRNLDGPRRALWNDKHVGKGFDCDFLDKLERYINKHIKSAARP